MSFAVVDEHDQVVGYAQIYAHDFRSGTAYVGFALDAACRRVPHVLESFILLVDYAFASWNFRKLYLEVPAWNLDQIVGGVGRIFVEEGRLRQHEWIDGTYWDLFVLALYRDRWRERPWASGDELRRRLLGGDPPER